MQAVYQDGSYLQNNPTWHEEDSPWKALHICQMLHDNNVPIKTIAEVGCGTGSILFELRKKYPTSVFTGYEIAPWAFEAASARYGTQITFKLADLLEEDVPCFDVLLAIDVVEHVEDYLGFLKKLKSKGRVKLFHFPLDMSVQSVWRGWPITRARETVGHLHYFMKDTVLASLKDCGYTIRDHRYTPSRLELPNQVLTSRLMKLPRRLLHSISPDLTARIVGGYSLLVLAE
jgi:cyclopropane fatty-acyl-phospholipid synthase-like methyltransferase